MDAIQPVVFDPSKVTLTIDGVYITGLGESPITFDYRFCHPQHRIRWCVCFRCKCSKERHMHVAGKDLLPTVCTVGGIG